MKKRIFLTSVEELVKVITKLDSQLLAKKKDKEKQGIVFDTQPIILFRGEEDVSFKLLPSIFRTEKLKKNENRLFNKLFSAHADEFEKDRNTFDKLVRMQHYGLPTRLLDVTKNPLVALYFACQPAFTTGKSGNKEMNEKDGSLYFFILQDSHIKTYNSDTIAIISNLVNLKSRELNAFLSIKQNDTYERAFAKLVNAIKRDDPSFSGDYLDVNKIPDFVFVEPKMNNERVKSQSGAFIMFKNSKEMNEGNIKLPYKDASGKDCEYTVFCYRIIIPYSKKESILQVLDKMNINEKYIYQDIQHTANYIKNYI